MSETCADADWVRASSSLLLQPMRQGLVIHCTTLWKQVASPGSCCGRAVSRSLLVPELLLGCASMQIGSSMQDGTNQSLSLHLSEKGGVGGVTSLDIGLWFL